MRLSEAIRLGAMMKPQVNGMFYFDGRTCALGAALDACGALNMDDPYDYEQNVFLERRWPVVALPQRCPVCAALNLSNTVLGVIQHVNDFHQRTRERIADFVEGVEAAQGHGQPAPERCGTTAVEQPVVAPRA